MGVEDEGRLVSSLTGSDYLTELVLSSLTIIPSLLRHRQGCQDEAPENDVERI